jgi:hypothetical protein
MFLINTDKLRNCWLFGLCPSSDIVDTRKHNVSETGSVSVLRWGGGGTYIVGSLRANLNHWITSIRFTTAIELPVTTLIRREVAGKYAIKIVFSSF